jgi:peptidoglycan/LPS O-acetylase OafA/YrhL
MVDLGHDRGMDRGGTAPPEFGYQPALDGLRAVAVGSVIAFHFGAVWAPGGFLGVDTFFVLSGYLITSLLLVEWGRTGGLRFGAFWVRRLRRLLPALLLVLLAIAIWASVEAASTRLDLIRADSLWTLFYGANWHFIDSGQSYFDLFSEASPLRHAWSLAIEEQFYLVWPLIAYACLRLGRGRHGLLATVCVVGTVASGVTAWRLYDSADPSRAYFGTDSRASQLLVGALLAIVLAHWAPRTRASRVAIQVAGVAAAGLCAGAFVVARDFDAWLYPAGFIGFAVATAVVIAAVVQPAATPLRRALSLRPVRWVGLISYGLYLWHWPVQVAVTEGRTGLDGWTLAGVRLGLTFAFATASYYLVELPIRHGGLRGLRGRLAAPMGIALTASILLVATSGGTTPPAYLTTPPGETLETPRRSSASVVDPGTAAVGVAPLPAGDAAAPLPTRFLLIGDSVPYSFAPALQAEAPAHGISVDAVTRPGCGVLTGRPELADGTPIEWGGTCEASAEPFQRVSVHDRQPQVIVWVDSWWTSDRRVNGEHMYLGTPAGNATFMALLEQARQNLTLSGARLVLLTVPPRADSPLGPAHDGENHRIAVVNRMVRELAANHPDTVSLVEFAELVCPGGPPCPTRVGGVELRPGDGAHFGEAGAVWVAPRLIEQVLLALRFVSSHPSG